jgi:basic membrane lipoprotein Med (substrate-binding protein (PBP1-ABC) superfamily)
MRFTQRRVVAVVAAAAAIALTAACGGNTGNGSTNAQDSGGTGSTSAKPLVYGVFSTPIEEPWDGAVHRAVQALADEGKITYKHVDNVGTSGGMERTLRDIAQNDKPVMIVGDSYGNEDVARKVAKDFPKIAFVMGSGEAPVEPNYAVFDNWLQDPAYLAGMLAGEMTKSNTVGVVGGIPVPEINRIVNAFVKGAQSTNPKVNVKVTFINTFFDPAKAKQAALAQVAQGADVLFAERDGVIEAAKEKGLPSIGMMVDQKEQAPESVMTSLVWNMQPTIEEAFKEVQAGTFKGVDMREFSFMKNGGSELAEINTGIKGGIPDDLVAKVMDQQKKIMSGEFTTPIDDSEPKGSISVGS